MPDSEESMRVLIVDDERTIADTLVTIFTNEGHEARAAYTAEQALALIDEWVPEVAILDVCLPGMNGVDLAIRVRAEIPGCRVTLFSGHGAASELQAKASEDGFAFDLMAKPVHPSDLLSLIAGAARA